MFPTGVLLAALVCVVSLIADSLAARQPLSLAGLQSASGSPYVVVIGTSRARFGIENDERFTAQPGLPESLVLKRITQNGGVPRSFEPALTALLANPPNLLLVESDLLLVDRNSRLDRPWWSTSLPELQWALRTLGPNVSVILNRIIGSNPNVSADVAISSAACARAWSATGRRAHAAKVATYQVAQLKTVAPLLTLLRQLQGLGTTVVLLDIPVSPTAARHKPKRLNDEFTDWLQDLRSYLRAPFWSPGVLPDSDYCDLGHLNEEGRERYSGWLAEQIIVWQESRN